MAVAVAVVLTLVLSGFIALGVVYAPGFGLRKRPGPAIGTAIIGAEVAIGALVTMIGVPVAFGNDYWQSIVTDYFLAESNRLIGGAYPFFWEPHWLYVVGSLTPLIALGASIALAAGLVALPRARRTALVVVAIAGLMLVAYLTAGLYAVIMTWGGVPL